MTVILWGKHLEFESTLPYSTSFVAPLCTHLALTVAAVSSMRHISNPRILAILQGAAWVAAFFAVNFTAFNLVLLEAIGSGLVVATVALHWLFPSATTSSSVYRDKNPTQPPPS